MKINNIYTADSSLIEIEHVATGNNSTDIIIKAGNNLATTYDLECVTMQITNLTDKIAILESKYDDVMASQLAEQELINSNQSVKDAYMQYRTIANLVE